MEQDDNITGVLRGGLLNGWHLRLNQANAKRRAIRFPLPGDHSVTYRLVGKRADGAQVYAPASN